MRGVRLLVITLLGVWLEVSFLGAWRPFGIVPNLFLVVILLAAGTLTKASEALAVAVGGGFLLDLVSGSDFGLRTAFFSFLALLIVVIRRTGADFDQLSMELAAVVSGTVLYDATILVSLLSRHDLISWHVVGSRVGIELVVNVVLVIVLRWPLQKLLAAGANSGASVAPGVR